MADTATFIRAVAAAREPAPRWQQGTIGEALVAWRRSPEYKALAPRTRYNRDHYTQPLDAIAGSSLASIRRATILDMRDKVAEASGPAAANMLAQSISSFLGWCLSRGRLEYNPAFRIPHLAGGHFAPWTESDARRAMAEFAEPQRRAVVLAYHLGQRRGDLCAMTWAAYDGRTITLQPEKTRRRREARQMPALRLPVHPELRRELDAWKAANALAAQPVLTILTTTGRRPWKREYLNLMIKAEVDRLGLPAGLNLHGFRKLAANRLSEAGATTKEIAAALGWESLAHVELYTRGADQERLAHAAIVRIGGDKP